MKGSAVNNIKFDPTKQKIVNCDSCRKEVIVKKFSGNNQKCQECINGLNKKSSNLQLASKKSVKTVKQPVIVQSTPEQPFASVSADSNSVVARFSKLATELGFKFDPTHESWKKKYVLSDGGDGILHAFLKPGIAGAEPSLDYFVYIEQRAISLNDIFRDKMNISPAEDCETLAAEFSNEIVRESKVDHRKCDMCGISTYEFFVDNKSGKLFCHGANSNNCAKKKFNNVGAESVG